MAVRPLTQGDYDALRDIRLEALARHPTAFAADPELESAMDRDAWLARLASAVTLGGFVDDALMGIVVFSRPTSRKLAHTGDLGAMYVRGAARGSGLADALVTAAIETAAGSVEQIKLTVNAANTRAIRFYARHGFREIGRIPRSLNIAGIYYDEVLMLRTITPRD
ncbi:MAG: GNAT family N-acetyltransferase [Alphaproteobacteria bacterium]|nr:GNAT family N-acetyltransferase [Alphaproteobacteria bacterium]MBV9695065.1 GNAT family N-acetyltransferase [Alphaproteobacteria bacterium]